MREGGKRSGPGTGRAEPISVARRIRLAGGMLAIMLGVVLLANVRSWGVPGALGGALLLVAGALSLRRGARRDPEAAGPSPRR